MKYIKLFRSIFIKRLSFSGSSYVNTQNDGVVQEFLEIVNKYRDNRQRRESLIIETAFALRKEEKDFILERMSLPENTPVIEKLNPFLIGVLQIVYKNKIYTIRTSDKIETIRTFFVNN